MDTFPQSGAPAAGRRMDEELARLGLTEDELLAEFRRRLGRVA